MEKIKDIQRKIDNYKIAMILFAERIRGITEPLYREYLKDLLKIKRGKKYGL